MIAELERPVVEETTSPKRTGRRKPEKPGVQEPKPLDRPTSKSSNPELDKLSVYVPIQTLKKLTVASALWDKDKSDIVADLLAEKLSGIAFYDRNSTRMPAQTLTVTEIGSDRSAD
jgi:hypothetical protein